MVVIFVCDGCGEQRPGSFTRMGDAVKPHQWFMRGDDDGTQTACSRECIKRIAEASGKTSVVLPI